MPVNGSQKNIYESIKMLSPDNTFMCYTTQKRAEWYVKKGLANWISDEEFKINFEPNGNGKANIDFYTEVLKNQCVVCGESEIGKLNKHHVVPKVFRSRFPSKYKNYNHHDIVAICISCHEAYELIANDYRKKLLDEKGISVTSKKEKLIRENKKIISARKLLENINDGKIDGNIIPADKIILMKEIAKKDLINISSKKEVDWADQLVATIKNEKELYEFVKNWRQHFINTMKPKYMPEKWSVYHPLEVDITGDGFVVD